MNNNIEKMADLLRSGNTMLNMACPVCNQPIFRNREGNTFCPTCNRKVLIVNEKANQNLKTQEEETKINIKKLKFNQNRQAELLNSLQTVIFEKIDLILSKLRNETQLQIIEANTKVLLNCLEILKRIPT